MRDADTCTPTETGSQGCTGDSIEVCDDTNWNLMQDCTGAGEICVSLRAGIAMCEAAPWFVGWVEKRDPGIRNLQ